MKKKVTAFRNKNTVWVVWNVEEEINGWTKLLPNKWNKLVDGG